MLLTSQSLRVPVLSPVLRDRRLVAAISAIAILQLGLVSFGLPGWPCPFQHLVGVPCPGCGLTRAAILLFRGHWQQSFTFHAFAPIFVIALMFAVCAALLPKTPRERIIAVAESVERSTGISSWLLIGLILYWLARLLLMQGAFIQLIRG